MREILGQNLINYFTSPNGGMVATCTYSSPRYEVWEVPEDVYFMMHSQSEEKFMELAGPDAWWRWSEGSSLGIPTRNIKIKNHTIKVWKMRNEPLGRRKFTDVFEYLCEYVGASTEKNVCACLVDLAKYNKLTMGELLNKVG